MIFLPISYRSFLCLSLNCPIFSFLFFLRCMFHKSFLSKCTLRYSLFPVIVVGRYLILKRFEKIYNRKRDRINIFIHLNVTTINHLNVIGRAGNKENILKHSLPTLLINEKFLQYLRNNNAFLKILYRTTFHGPRISLIILYITYITIYL